MRHGVARVWVVLVVALLGVGCAHQGVGTWRAELGGPFVVAAPVLQPGDVVLTRAADPVSAMIARNCSTPGTYSHSGMVCTDDQQRLAVLHLTSDGLKREPLPSFLYGRARVAFLRCQTPPSAAQVASAVRTWEEKFRQGGVQFELTFRAGATDGGHFSCMDIISRTYQQAGLPEPFPPPTGVMPEDGWTRFASDLLGVPIDRMPTANRILDNPAFHVVALWANVDIDDRRLVLDDALAEAVRGFYVQGYVARPPTGASRAMASCVGATRSDPRMARLYAARATLYHFATPVENTVLQQWRAAPDGQVTPGQIRAWTAAAANAYRDEYFAPAKE